MIARLVADGDDGGMADLAEVRELFAEQCLHVRRIVSAHARASEPLVEDACQVAWERLVRRRARVRRETATAWLVRTAVREAFRLKQREGRDVSLELISDDDDGRRPRHTPPLLDELAAQRARLDSIRTLSERQQRLIWLQAFGLTYDEMASQTATTSRTVERQLGRARRSMARDAA